MKNLLITLVVIGLLLVPASVLTAKTSLDSAEVQIYVSGVEIADIYGQPSDSLTMASYVSGVEAADTFERLQLDSPPLPVYVSGVETGDQLCLYC
jgi:hypothetical protein